MTNKQMVRLPHCTALRFKMQVGRMVLTTEPVPAAYVFVVDAPGCTADQLRALSQQALQFRGNLETKKPDGTWVIKHNNLSVFCDGCHTYFELDEEFMFNGNDSYHVRCLPAGPAGPSAQ